MRDMPLPFVIVSLSAKVLHRGVLSTAGPTKRSAGSSLDPIVDAFVLRYKYILSLEIRPNEHNLSHGKTRPAQTRPTRHAITE